jgi:flagellar basal-body rod protein FlgB
MFPSMFSNSSLGSLEKTIEFAERRHSILASNVANMDTPDYKTRDLSVDDFQKSLKHLTDVQKKVEADSPGLRLTVLDPPIDEETLSVRDQAVQNVHDSMRQVQYHDGSDDSMEMQVSQLAKNQSMHSTAVALMRSQFQTLKMAISESVNV